LLTFLLFIVGFGITGILISTDSPDYLVVLAQIIMAWTPTMAYAFIHRKVDPGRPLWRFIADLFAKRIRLLPLLASIFIPVAATLIVWLGYSAAAGKAPASFIAGLSVSSLLVMFFDSLVRGPLGEELGWRGFLQNELNKRFPLLKSSLIVGVIWALWHLPLWFVSGFEGTNLLLYILFFMVGLISFSVIIGFVYDRGGNLLYPIVMHQMLNFAGRLLEIDELVALGGSSAVYMIIAIVIGVFLLRSKRELATAT